MNTDLLSLFDADEASVQAVLRDTLANADDGELFIEHAQAESLSFDNGRLKGGSFNTDQGFGLRAVSGEAVGYAHSGEMSLSALKRAADAAGAVTRGHSGTYAEAPQGTNRKLYGADNPIGSPSFEEKVKLLTEIDADWTKGGNQAFDFIGKDGFSGTAGELRFRKISGDTIVYGDPDGDGKAEFSLKIDASINLVKGDFIL